MDKLPKIGLPIIIGVVIIIIILAKSAITIGSGEAGVLYKTFGGGVVTEDSASYYPQFLCSLNRLICFSNSMGV